MLPSGHLQACWTSASARSIRKLAVQRRASQLYLPLGLWGQGSNSCLHLHTPLSILDVHRFIDAIWWNMMLMLSLVFYDVLCRLHFSSQIPTISTKTGRVIHPNQLAKDRSIQIRTCSGSRVGSLNSQIRRSVGSPPEMQRSLREACFFLPEMGRGPFSGTSLRPVLQQDVNRFARISHSIFALSLS